MRIISDSTIWLTVMLLFTPSMLLVGLALYNDYRNEEHHDSERDITSPPIAPK